MRTTVDIPDALYADLKMQAVEENTTVKALLHQAARLIVSEGRMKKSAGDMRRRPWPTLGSSDSPKIASFDNDFALFGGDPAEQ